MKIRTRLTILFTIITATILLIFVIATYLSSKASRENEFYDLLKKEGITKANLLLKTGIDEKTLQDIYHSNKKSLNEVEVAVYSDQYALLYHDAVEIDFVKETPELLSRIHRNGEVLFYQEDWQIAGIRYEIDNIPYIITAAAYDEYGYNKLNTLLKNSLIFFTISILFIYLAGIFFSRKALSPVSAITEKVRRISATSLDLRLDTIQNRDELFELSATFNQMLDRLESSFEAQKNFVSNIAHELRTPLTSIIAELELSGGANDDNESYKKAIRNTLDDARRVTRLTNSLLDLARASYDSAGISFKPVRIDETILDARLKVQQENTEFNINIYFESDLESEDMITIPANEYLLKVAFSNLFENGCKFSPDRQCTVFISFTTDTVCLRFTDKGIGIPAEDIPHIFAPFYRGKNKSNSHGNGIGLSLVEKIISLHKGSIEVSSEENAGAVFTVQFPNH